MDKETFDALGRHDPVAQNNWCKERDKELRKLWRCSLCGKWLPIKGTLWNTRWDNFRYLHRLGKDPENSGYICERCRLASIGVD